MRLRAMREEHAQATVEMAVVAPVMLVVALIVYNVMDGYDVEVDVEAAEQAGGDSATGGSLLHMVGSLRTYRCTMRYAPWPQGLVVAGVDMGAPLDLTHTRSITVDPWRPGVVM